MSLIKRRYWVLTSPVVICALGRPEYASCRAFMLSATQKVSPPSYAEPPGIPTRYKDRENSLNGGVAPCPIDLSHPAAVQTAQFTGLHFSLES
jgi:hypothetical protein